MKSVLVLSYFSGFSYVHYMTLTNIEGHLPLLLPLCKPVQIMLELNRVISCPDISIDDTVIRKQPDSGSHSSWQVVYIEQK